VLVRTTTGTPGSTTGFVHQGGTYKIYAQVSDATSGVASVAVNATNVTTGQSAAAMSSGAFTVAGQTYNYASAELTANAVLAEGAKTVTVTATDNATNAGTLNPSATVDNTAPTAVMTDPGARIRATVTLGATGSDSSAGLESLVIRRSPTGANNWTTVCTVASSPASCSFDTTTVTDGGYDFQAISTDAAGNTTTSTTVSNRIVDNTPPTALSIATTNKGGGTAGKAEAGDTIVYGFSEAMDPTSLLAGWNGTSTSVLLKIVNASPDAVQIWNSGNTTQLNFGSVALGTATNYVSATATFNATMVMSGNNVTVTLGTLVSGTVTTGGNANLVWSPSTPVAPLDLAGNSMTTTAFTQGGAAAKRF
jgi:chitinase